MAQRNRSHRSNMRHQFGKTPPPSLQRSTFDRSCSHKTTFNAGRIIPIYWSEVLPGDTVTLSVSHVVRMATPIKPVMDNLWIDFQHWFVPLRQLWDNFPYFMGEQESPGDSTDFLVPQNDNTGNPVNEFGLLNYLGLPVGFEGEVSAFPIRCYDWIYHNWYRDENLNDSIPQSKDDGPDARTGGSFPPPRS